MRFNVCSPLFHHLETTKTAHNPTAIALFLPLFPLTMTCMHNEVWGCAEIFHFSSLRERHFHKFSSRHTSPTMYRLNELESSRSSKGLAKLQLQMTFSFPSPLLLLKFHIRDLKQRLRRRGCERQRQLRVRVYDIIFRSLRLVPYVKYARSVEEFKLE